MKGVAKKAAAYAEKHGYTFERQNSKGVNFYRNGAGHEIGINPGVDERGFHAICKQVDRARGVGPDLSQKHNSAAIKARQERERTLLAEERRRHRERLDALAREKSAALLGGLGNSLTLRQVQDIERLIEAEVAAHRETVRAMSCTPTGGAA